MHFVIFGSGSVGGFFGARLARSGEQVTFVARGAHLKAMQTTGLRVDSIEGDFTLPQVAAVGEAAEAGAPDFVIVAVKNWQVPEAAEAIKPVVGERTLVLPLMNGVEAPDQLAAVLGAEHVLGGLCRLSVYLAGPGHIRHVGLVPYVAFNHFDNHTDPRVEALRQAFAAAGLNVEVPSDIQAALWNKFLYIAPYSGVAAVTRASMGVIRTLPQTRGMLIEAMREIEAVGRARGVNLAPDVVEKTLALVDASPAGLVASMARDIMEGRPSELDSQTGAVVRLGLAADVPVPINTYIYVTLLPTELMTRGQLP
jgi:2-dehydropantoate 2-reductase